MNVIADLIPATARRIVYLALGTVVGLEAVWDVVPDVLEGKVLATLTVLGFGLAAANVPPAD
jgi:hypothetical protein